MTISAEDYIIYNICEYPSLYANSTFNISMLKVLNQLLNVIGNGIRDDEELIEDINKIQMDDKHNKDVAMAYINENIYYKSTDHNDFTIVRESELKNYSEAASFMKCSKNPFKPYPNFEKEYSLTWKCPVFLTLGNDWLEYALKFYRHCKVWMRKNENKYYYAFPKETTEKTRTHLRACVQHQKLQGGYKENYILLSNRWQKEKARILNFIDETIQKLNEAKS